MSEEGGELNHGSIGGMAAESVDDGNVLVGRALRLVAVHTFASTTDQMGRIWRCRGVFKGFTPMPLHRNNCHNRSARPFNCNS